MMTSSQLAARWIVRVGMAQPDLIYTGIFIDPMDQKRLFRAFGQSHDLAAAHHLTLWHFSEGTEPDLDLPWGRSVVLKVTAHVENDKVQAVVVQPPSGLRPSNGRTPHITISHDQGVGPKESNDLLTGWAPDQKVVGLPAVRGKVGWVDSRGAVHYTAPPIEA